MEDNNYRMLLRAHIPVVLNYLPNHPALSFQRDRGPGHNSEATLAFKASQGLVPISWPLFSPDLSLIESIWDIMKDTLQEIDPELHRKFKRLRGAVLRAWNALIDAEIRAEISTMRQRCQDVIDIQGMETKW
jgi:hypothetical protein